MLHLLLGYAFLVIHGICLLTWLQAMFMLYEGISLKLGVLGLGIHMWNLPPLQVMKFFEVRSS